MILGNNYSMSYLAFSWIIYRRSKPLNSASPLNTWNRMHPTLNKSAFSLYLCPLSISGAIKPGVPHFCCFLADYSSFRLLDIPKSMSLISYLCLLSIIRFWGWMSLCTIWWECMKATANSSWKARSRISVGVSTWRSLLKKVARLSPATYSINIIMKSLSSYTLESFGKRLHLLKSRWFLISLSKKSYYVSFNLLFKIIFAALYLWAEACLSEYQSLLFDKSQSFLGDKVFFRFSTLNTWPKEP